MDWGRQSESGLSVLVFCFSTFKMLIFNFRPDLSPIYPQFMQNTRLSTVVDNALGRFSRSLQNPWRRLSLLLITVLTGNFLASTISTVAGQKAELDVLAAFLLVLFSELISWLVYRGDRSRSLGQARPAARSLLLDVLNGLKLGLAYGLFLEAFKLGS